MRKFHIIVNSGKDPEGKYTDILKQKITDMGAETVDIDDAEAILVLGGDGTLLKAAGDNFGLDKPILGVNLGTLGYLTEADFDNIEDSLKILINDTYEIDERMMLFGSVITDDGKHEDHSLNDVVITGYGGLALVRYDIYVNGELLSSYAADGLVISTPTGSTGYNMSAGGPILEPGASILVVTPICPHTLNNRSIVLSASDEITVKISDDQRTAVAVQFDGREPYMLGPGMSVSVCKSEHITRIIKLHKESFLKTLHSKLK